MKIKFLGAAGTVTGSKYLLTVDNKKILVDCGLFQGQKKWRLKNWSHLPIKPAEIDSVVITHAHIDHTGYLPRLVKNGFTGNIYATEATYDLCKILLPDSAHIQEEDARRANKYGYSKHQPAQPLYTQEDAENALKHFKIVDFGSKYNIHDDCVVSWHRAGHILGAAMVRFEIHGARLLFSGDLGRLDDPVMKAPAAMQAADYIILESTYGNRLHAELDPKDYLAEVINRTTQRGGSVLIPAFAVGRCQAILHYLAELSEAKLIANVPIYLDSPLSISATELLCKHHAEHKLSKQQCQSASNIAIYVNTRDESKAITQDEQPKIVISASGMMTGGRVLHHLKTMGTNSKNTILVTGFQASGTRGADLLVGKRQLKIHGEIININAEIDYITNTSAHADYSEILIWLENFNIDPRLVYLTHGEHESALSLRKKIEEKFGWTCKIPNYLDEDEI